MKAFRFAMWGMVAVFAAILSFFYWQSLQGQYAGSLQIGAPFKLTAARGGGVVDLTELLGKPYGVFFGFTHCPEVCPTTLLEMTEAYDTLGAHAKDFRLFFITVDPERDTPHFLNGYLENFDTRIEGLVPTIDQLRIVAQQFRAVYEIVPTSDGSYTMNHTASVFLFDKAGQFAGTLSYGEDAKLRVGKLQRLLSK